MRIGILGSLSLRESSRSLTPTAPKQRQVLALLLINANRFTSTSALIEEVWGDAPPRSAATTLQTYVLQLRRRLTRDGDSRLAELLGTEPGGYVLRTDGHAYDLLEYEQLADEGRRSLRAGDHGRAADLLGGALRQWRGPALADVMAGELLRAQIIRLEESRLETTRLRIDAELELGNHHELVGELAALAVRHPTNEDLHGRLMLALYRSGRQSDALEVFARLRAHMVGALGVEPAEPLRLLQQAVLAADPVLYPTRRPPAATS